MESTDGRIGAAAKHLELLREGGDDRHAGYYVTLAFTYGLTVPQIVEESGLPLAHVRHLLGGA